MDLFGDLPEPAASNSNNSSVCKEKEKSTVDGHQDERRGEKRKNEDVFKEVPKKSANDLYLLKVVCAERKGEREEMQDAHMLIEDFLSDIQIHPSSVHRLSYYAVFDGHGGTRASKYAAQHLHKIITQKFPKDDENLDKDLRKCFIESFKKLDEDFLNEARRSKPSWKDGTTAVTLLAVNNNLYIGNLGDSKAVLCRYNESTHKFVALPLTIDHNPTLYDERMRIQKAGGHVREGRVMGILEVSRSIGDGSFKQHGVTCIPDVKRCQLTDNDRFVLIACDGLWKRFEDNSAIEFINSILDDKKIEGTETKDANEVRMELACNKLANEAVRRLSADNVTVILVSITRPVHRT